MKEEYVEPKIEIMDLTGDILTASTGSDTSKPVELPFVPFS